MSASQSERRYFLDNLRTFTVFLVVVLHAAMVYEGDGWAASFWIVDDPATNDLSGFVVLSLDILVMPTLFFVSGYVAPASLNTKSGWRFIRAKFRRLMLPWAIGVLTLIPLYKVIFLASRGLPQEHWSRYFYFNNGLRIQGWLWFLPVVFLFNVLYLLGSRMTARTLQISLKRALCVALALGFAYSLSMDLLGFRGWTMTPVLMFQNERVMIYFLAFLLGALCFNQDVFRARPNGQLLYRTVILIAWAPIAQYGTFFLHSWMYPERSLVSPLTDRVILWFGYCISVLCLLYVMVETFRRYLYNQGRFQAELNRNSYGVYIVHTVVLGGLATVLLPVALPSLAKFAILTGSTYLTCHAIVHGYRRIVETGIRSVYAKRSEQLHPAEETTEQRWEHNSLPVIERVTVNRHDNCVSR